MNRKRILIVEDDASMRQVLVAQMKTSDYDALPAPDALTALAQAQKNLPDLILLDLGLPGGGGLNLMQRLQSIPKLSVIPIIVISAREGIPIEREVLDKGAAAFFKKPVDFPQLLVKIRELLGEPQR